MDRVLYQYRTLRVGYDDTCDAFFCEKSSIFYFYLVTMNVTLNFQTLFQTLINIKVLKFSFFPLFILFYSTIHEDGS